MDIVGVMMLEVGRRRIEHGEAERAPASDALFSRNTHVATLAVR